MTRRTTRLIALLTSLTCAVGAPAEEAVRYDDHKVVRAHPQSQADIERVHHLGGRLLSCDEGIGPVDYIVAPDAMKLLDAAGIDYELRHDNVQDLIDAERARIEAHRAAGLDGGGWLFDEYKDFSEINQYLQTLMAVDAANATAMNRPPLLTDGVMLIGKTIEGRAIPAVRISGAGDDKDAILLNGTQHAREWITPMVNMYIIDRLVRTYDTDSAVKDLLDQVEVIVVPVVNPDGYEYAWTTDRFWRKNRRDNGNGTFGVDTNRNWDFGWGGIGSSGSTASEIYRGPYAFSEPETQVMRDLFGANPNIVATIDFHAYSQLVLSPWGHKSGTPGNDGGLHDRLGLDMSNAIRAVHGQRYIHGPAYDTIYPASGVSIDWTWGSAQALSWTIELRDRGFYGFVLPPEFILPTAEENFPAIFVLADPEARRRFAPPHAVSTTLGAYLAGTVESLFADDSNRFGIEQRAALLPTLPLIRAQVQGTLPTDRPSVMTFRLEATAHALPAESPQVLELWNYETSLWEIVDERLATLMDSIVEVEFDAVTAGPFIEPGTADVQARISWFDPGAVLYSDWGAWMDQAVWSYVP